MNGKTLIILMALLFSPPARAQDEIPDGFRVVGGIYAIRLNSSVVKKVLDEAHTTNRLDYITRYTTMFSSHNMTSRIFAAWALGQFQSPRSWDALFTQSENEQDTNVIHVIAQSLAGLSGASLPGSDSFPEEWNYAEKLKEWREYYKKYGYLGVFREKYRRVKWDPKGNPELIQGEIDFVRGVLLEWRVPDFVPLLQEIEQETAIDHLRLECETALSELQETSSSNKALQPTRVP